MFTTILEETQPYFVECGTALAKEYPMALYQDDKNVYHVVGPKESIISSWKFIARFQHRRDALSYGRYLSHQKEPKWFVYFDNDKSRYIVRPQRNLHEISPKHYKYVRPFSTTEEADKYVEDCNFFYQLNNESEEIKYNHIRTELSEHENEVSTPYDTEHISNFDEAYKLLKEGKKVLGRHKGSSDTWINLSEPLEKIMNDWEFCLDEQKEYHLDVKITSRAQLEKIIHEIAELDDVEEVTRK